jgi:hypothetical protein
MDLWQIMLLLDRMRSAMYSLTECAIQTKKGQMHFIGLSQFVVTLKIASKKGVACSTLPSGRSYVVLKMLFRPTKYHKTLQNSGKMDTPMMARLKSFPAGWLGGWFDGHNGAITFGL